MSRFGSRQEEKRLRRDARGRVLLEDGTLDPEPDCHTVARQAVVVFLVRHFADQEQASPCCSFEVRRAPRDQEIALAEGIDVDIVTVRLAPRCVRAERKAG